MTASLELAKKANGDVRLDYFLGKDKRMRVWERIGAATLETTFREDGAVLMQGIVESPKVEERIADTIVEAGGGIPVIVDYTGVVLDKACPWCQKKALVRFTEAYRSRAEVPVVPLYHCRECRGKSYYLTDEYLTHLISSNPEMFDGADVERFKSDGKAFLSEMKAYIISSFASKKVKRIE
jgi:hypothetical protein